MPGGYGPGPHASGTGRNATIVERVLGGDWRPALWVALPAFAVVVATATLASLSQLFAGRSLYAPTVYAPVFVQPGYRDIGAWFHAIVHLASSAFGSPLFEHYEDGELQRGNSPLTITVAGVLVFALLLRRRAMGLGGAERVALVVRSVVVVVVPLVLLSLFGTSTSVATTDADDSQAFGQQITTEVSPGRVLGWALLLFVLVSVVVVARPLDGMSRRFPRVRLTEWRPAWFGALVATATSIGLGFVAALITGFVEIDEYKGAGVADRGDLGRLLPLSLGHGIDLGIDTWTIATLGKVTDGFGSDSDVTFSLFDRHGLSGAYFALLLLPVLSVVVAVTAMRRRFPDVPALAISRACYRMSLPIAGLFLVLAIPSRVHLMLPGEERSLGGHIGPAVLLGAVIILGWYLALGFAAGRVVLAAGAGRTVFDAGSPAAYGGSGGYSGYSGYGGYGGYSGYGAPEEFGPYGEPGPTGAGAPTFEPLSVGAPAGPGRIANPLVIGVVCAIVLLGGCVTAVLLQGGKTAPGAPTAVPSVDAAGGSGSYSYDTDTVGPTGGYETDETDPSYSDGTYSSDIELQNESARQALQELSSAEDSYFSDNSYYAADTGDLSGYDEPNDVTVDISYANSESWCATATGVDNQAPFFTYDSSDGYVTEGDNC